MKGAPETVLARCVLAPDERAAWDAQVAALAASGLKVIACGWRLVDPEKWDGREPESGYAVAGLLAFEERDERDAEPEHGRHRAGISGSDHPDERDEHERDHDPSGHESRVHLPEPLTARRRLLRPVRR